MGHAENSETDFIHSPCLPRRKTAAVALLQQASCNKGRCGEGLKDVNVFSAWPTRQHVVQRRNNREPCFFSKTDYQRYLDDLGQSAARFSCQLHVYVLMTNHVHLLVSSTQAYGISQMMQALGRRYVAYVNRCYDSTGTLWEERFKASLVDTENYLLTCMPYIEMNAVRANMVDHPAEYHWCSYGEVAGCGKRTANIREYCSLTPI